MGKAIIITYSGFQDHELIYPYYRLLGYGLVTHIYSDKRDELGRTYGILGTNMPCHFLLSEIEISVILNNYDLMVLPGGVKSLEKLRLDRNVIKLIKEWDKMGKIIASTCHGAQLLISAGITKGKEISGYYSLEIDIINSGGKYCNLPVCTDGNIISSPHYDHMGVWMETVLDIFKTKYETI